MLRKRLLGRTIVRPNKTTLDAQAETNESRIAHNDLLQALELRQGQGDRSCLADGLSPPGHALRWGAFPLDGERCLAIAQQ